MNPHVFVSARKNEIDEIKSHPKLNLMKEKKENSPQIAVAEYKMSQNVLRWPSRSGGRFGACSKSHVLSPRSLTLLDHRIPRMRRPAIFLVNQKSIADETIVKTHWKIVHGQIIHENKYINTGAALNAIKNEKIVPDGLATGAEAGGGGDESAY